MRPHFLGLALLAAALAGCQRGYRSALLPSARPDAGTTVYTLDIPAEYEILRVHYDPAGPVTGGTSSADAPYVHVVARHRATGEQRLLLYERVGERRAPVAIVRFEPREGM